MCARCLDPPTVFQHDGHGYEKRVPTQQTEAVVGSYQAHRLQRGDIIIQYVNHASKTNERSPFTGKERFGGLPPGNMACTIHQLP